jgi:transcription elongation factor GreA
MQFSASPQPLLSRDEYAAHKAELERLRAERDELMRAQGREARSYTSSDAAEELTHVQKDLAVIEARIAHLEQILNTARIVEDSGEGEDVVTLGSVVDVEYGPERKPMTLKVTGAVSSEPGAVSARSPVGAALMGRRAGEVAVAALPGGEKVEVAIVAVRPRAAE